MKTPIETLLDSVEYTEVVYDDKPDIKLPRVTHEGKLKIGEFEFTVYVLSNGQRIIPAHELEAFYSVFNPLN